MLVPLQITFRNFPSSPAVEEAVRERMDKLERLFPRIASCRVVIESPHNHRRRGNHFHVRIDLSVPGKELVARRDPPNDAHDDVYVAVRDAFEAMRRQVEAYASALHEHRPT